MKFIERKFLELNIISDDFPKKNSEAKYDYVESFNSNGYEKKIVENSKEEPLKKNKEELNKVLIDLEEILKYDLIFIFGESGSGKTTLLKEIAKKNNSKFYTLSCFNDEELNMTNKEKTIYLFDSIDEDLNENKMTLNKVYLNKLEKIFKKIYQLNINNKIILTCRNGYIYEYLNSIKVEKKIKAYELASLENEDIKKIASNYKVLDYEKIVEFLEKIKLKELVVRNIFVLSKIIEKKEEYLSKKSLKEIYKAILKEFFLIKTDNFSNTIFKNKEEILEKLSIKISTKYFCKENEEERLKLKGEGLSEEEEVNLKRLPIYEHKSLEEFLIAYFIHKKLLLKEMDLKAIEKIFFIENVLKRDMKEILYFLIDLEDNELKKLLLETDPTLLIKIPEVNLDMQVLIVTKNINFLQKNPYYMWSNWEYFRNNSKIDEDLNLKRTLLQQINDISSIENEVFYYLMCLLKNSKNRSLEDFIFTILEKRIEKYKSLRDILNGVFIENKSFNLKLHDLLKKKQKKLQDDFYYINKFLKLIYKRINVKDFIFYIKNMKEYNLKDIIKVIDLNYLLMIINELLNNYEEIKNYRRGYNQIIFLMNSLNEKNIVNKNEVLNILEKAIEKKILHLNKIKIDNLILSLDDKKKYFRKIFECGNDYIIFFKKEDIEENLEFLLSNYSLGKYKNTYIEISYKFEIEKINLLLKKEKRKIQTKYLDEEIQENLIELKINFQEEKLIQLIGDIGLDETYKKIKEDKRIDDNVNNLIIKYLQIGMSFKKNQNGFREIDYLIFKYLNNNTKLKMNDLIEKNKESIYNLLLYFNHEEFSDNLIRFLLQEEFFKEKILKDLDNLNSTILFSRNKEKIFEYLRINEVEALKIILEKEYLNYDWFDSQEEIILNKLSLKNNKNILDEKIKNSNGKLNETFLKYYLEEYDINYLFQLLNFEYSKNNFENIIECLEEVGNLEVELEKLTDETVEKIISFYNTNYEEYQEPKETVFDIDTNYKLNNFIFIKLFNALRNDKRIKLLQKLNGIEFKNRKIINYIAYTKKIILENQYKFNEVIDIIKNSKFEEKYAYFDNEKFIKDLLMVIEHLTELRLQIKLKEYKEDEINDLIRFGLEMKEYYVHDQRRGGESESKENLGERDLVIKKNNTTVTILEALILKSINKSNIKKHYNKLNINYDTMGNRVNYFLCYYLGNNFNPFIERYKELSNVLFNSDIEDLSSEYSEKSNIKIMRTKFKEKEIYHLLINFEN